MNSAEKNVVVVVSYLKSGERIKLKMPVKTSKDFEDNQLGVIKENLAVECTTHLHVSITDFFFIYLNNLRQI